MCLFSVSACDTGALRRSSEDGSVGILMTEQLLHRMPRFLSFHKLAFHLTSSPVCVLADTPTGDYQSE